MEKRTGKLSSKWKDSVGIKGVHKWLFREYGSADKCEMKTCEGRSKIFDWSLKKGFKYIKSRKAFWRLCRICHRKYDFTPEKWMAMSKNLPWVKERLNKKHRE